MRTPGILVFELDSFEAVKRQFADLPLMKAGRLTVDLLALRPFKNWHVLSREEKRTPVPSD